MLRKLHIKNFAIIDNLTIDFDNGFNVLTGETGSGKSIIIEALGVVLGGRSNKEMIKTGSDSAYVEALFYVDSYIKNKLDEFGIEYDELLVISREIYAGQPSIARVNNKTVTNNVLNAITSNLIDIFGQHEHQSLLDEKNHIQILDSFLFDESKSLLLEINQLYDEYLAIREKKKDMEIDSIQRERELDLIKYQIDEINSASLTSDDENIEYEYKKINNLEEIFKYGNKALDYIKGDYLEQNALDMIDKSLSQLKDLLKLDDVFQIYYDELQNYRFEISELSLKINNYLSSLYYDEERLLFLRERLDTINSLKKKYGNSINEILSYKNNLEEKYELLTNLENELKILDEKLNILEKNIINKSNKLTKYRQNVAKELEENIKKQLLFLNMENVNFVVNFNKRQTISRNGIDEIEFLISTNLGEKLKPLSKIISGGEMSRIMLALKAIFADRDNIPSLVFDEIDTGISGRTAQLVGEKIKEISKTHQVIAISHLPQIVALADSHFSIYKSSEDNITITRVSKLSFEERIRELARMLGGVSITDTTLRHAKEMLEMTNAKH
ncbi:DNA repair protein RecN [Soehngenia longivitae]|uniref:DNA repair protein RecN n=1 Tax=Soehngenia longivitae TaxID=2562294 RepID=A0A4Z0D1Y7_9FIRM|nr:DNA repair protein RecN [Soehngenia longivitae]TFZ39760.1 DNA repair protein RecN [Soehngenia longivitae]